MARPQVWPKTWTDERLTGSCWQLQYGFHARLSVLLTTGTGHRHPLWRLGRSAGVDGLWEMIDGAAITLPLATATAADRFPPSWKGEVITP